MKHVAITYILHLHMTWPLGCHSVIDNENLPVIFGYELLSENGAQIQDLWHCFKPKSARFALLFN